MNELQNLEQVFHAGGNEVHVDPALAKQAMIPLQRMLDFNAR